MYIEVKGETSEYNRLVSDRIKELFSRFTYTGMDKNGDAVIGASLGVFTHDFNGTFYDKYDTLKLDLLAMYSEEFLELVYYYVSMP